jgi:Domain of unknown function (DUF4194)
MRADAIAPYAPVVIKLLQGVVYHDDTTSWDLLLTHQTAIQDYFARIGVEVFVHEADGFAFLRQPELEDEEGERVSLPRLTRRDKLSYSVTLLCVLLRERLDQFDASASESDRLILTLEQLRDLARAFFPERNDERALFRKIDAAIERVVDLGFLRRLGASGDDERFEVRRILKARIDADKLAEIKRRLESYVHVDA